MSDTHDEYLPPTYLSRTLRVTLRTLERWARQGHIRTRPSPTRRLAKLYNLADAKRLAATQVPPPSPAAPSPGTATELVPLSDMLAQLNRKDDQLVEANAQLQRAALEIGNLRSQLEVHQKILEDKEQRRVALESERDRVVVERDRLHADLSRLPWWVRILFLRGR